MTRAEITNLHNGLHQLQRDRQHAANSHDRYCSRHDRQGFRRNLAGSTERPRRAAGRRDGIAARPVAKSSRSTSMSP